MKLKWMAGILSFSLLFAPGISNANMSQDQLEAAEKKLKELKKRVKKLERTAKRNKKTSRKNMRYLSSLEERMKINGFMSVGASISDTESGFGEGNLIDKHGTFSEGSKAGLQMTFKLDDETEFVSQLVTYLASDPEVVTEWAYLGYQLNDDLKVRAGRVVSPLYFFSEFANANFAHPWARPPREIYFLGSSNADGVDFLYNKEIGDWSTSWQLLFATINRQGAFNDPESITTFKDSFYFNTAWSKGPLTLKGSYTKGQFGLKFNAYENLDSQIAQLEGASGIEIADPFNDYLVQVGYMSLGAEYNDGNFYALVEYVNVNWWESAIVTPNQESGFVTLGYRMGKFMPYMTIAKTYAKDTQDINAIQSALAEAGTSMTSLLSDPTTGMQGFISNLSQAAEDLNNGVSKANSTSYQDALFAATENDILAGLGFAQLLAGNPNGFDLKLLAAQTLAGADDLEEAVKGVPAAIQGFENLKTTQTSYMIGTRYDWTPRIAVKAEVLQFENFHGTNGRFSSSPPPGKKANVLNFAIDAVF